MRCCAGWLALLLVASGCGGGVDKGEVGTARYFGALSWEEPLRVMPPVRDRQGNVYVGLRQVNNSVCVSDAYDVFVGKASGGWSNCKDLRKENRRVHGWVGFGAKDAFFWSGDALVKVTGESGECTRLLDSDPTTGADMFFRAVAPWVRDRPSRRTMLALVKTPADVLPYHVVVDVDRAIYTDLRDFEPRSATNVVPMGVGGNASERTAVMLVWYELEGSGHVVAIFLDQDGDETGRTEVTGIAGALDSGSSAQWQDSVVGFAAMNSSGRAAALLSTGELVFVSESTSRVSIIDTMTADGVQLWDDRLWLVGTDGSSPALAEISSRGTAGSPEQWNASLDIAARLSDGIEVIDERSSPRKVVTWYESETAIGPYPLVAPYSLLPYGENSVGWVVGGPSYTSGIDDRCRSVAFVPVGVSYP
ncbi:MAG: hypothetical protein AAB426_02070 [Myxococcota bacterium]|mgnify:CR=1 FL=1